MSKLSLADKMAIKGGLHDGKTVEEITSVLNNGKAASAKKSEALVQKYIDTELDQLATTIAKVQTESSDENVVYVPESVKKAAFKDLVASGLTNLDAQMIVDKAATNAKNNKRKYTDIKPFYTLCIKSMRAGQFMIKKGNGGRGGVTMMTGAASARTDRSVKYAKKKSKGPAQSRSARGAIYRPDTDTVE